jgi:hypothetical protein
MIMKIIRVGRASPTILLVPLGCGPAAVIMHKRVESENLRHGKTTYGDSLLVRDFDEVSKQGLKRENQKIVCRKRDHA